MKYVNVINYCTIVFEKCCNIYCKYIYFRFYAVIKRCRYLYHLTLLVLRFVNI